MIFNATSLEVVSLKIAQCDITLKSVCISPEVYVQSGESPGESYRRICSIPRIFKTNCKLLVCAKRKNKTKRNFSSC